MSYFAPGFASGFFTAAAFWFLAMGSGWGAIVCFAIAGVWVWRTVK